MKIGVISDTHISTRMLDPKQLASRLINRVATTADELIEIVRPHFAGADLIIHAGDWVSYAVVEALEELAPVEGVAGNMDPHEVSSRLPVKKVVNAGGKRIGVMHGWGAPTGLEVRIRKEFEEVDLIVFGHSHQQFSQPVNNVLMFNPGSPTDQRWAPTRSIGIIELDGEVRTRHIPLR
jgi:putative phosphoesterase